MKSAVHPYLLPARYTGFLSRAAVLDTSIVSVLFLLACWQYFALIDEVPFHRDEARWIHRAAYVRELVHPFSSYWDESTWIERGGTLDEQYRLRAQPPLGSYLMGLGLLLQGRDLDTNGFWNMDVDTARNASLGNMPASADLTAARRTTAVVSAVTVVVVYFIGASLTNRVGGVVAALFLLFHPLVNLYASFAGSDMLLMLLVALATMAAYRLAAHPSWRRAVLLGVLLGLGGATKLSPLGVTIPLALLGGLIVLRRVVEARMLSGPVSGSSTVDDSEANAGRWHRVGTFGTGRSSVAYGMQLASAPVVAFATMVASYPYLWRAPLDNTLAMFEFRTSGMELQASIWEHVAVESPVDALRRVGTRLGNEFTVLSRLGAALQEQFGVSWEAGGIELWLAAVGLLVFLGLVFRRGLTNGHGLAMVVLGGQAAITIVGMGVDWARYHLPILLFVAICAGVAVGQGWTVVHRVQRAIRRMPASSP